MEAFLNLKLWQNKCQDGWARRVTVGGGSRPDGSDLCRAGGWRHHEGGLSCACACACVRVCVCAAEGRSRRTVTGGGSGQMTSIRNAGGAPLRPRASGFDSFRSIRSQSSKMPLNRRFERRIKGTATSVAVSSFEPNQRCSMTGPDGPASARTGPVTA